MKFLKLKSNLTQDQITDIMDSFTQKESRDIRFLYMFMPHVNFIDSDGTISMFIVVDEYDFMKEDGSFDMGDMKSSFDKLTDIYKEKGINFSVENLTKDVLLSKEIKSDYKTIYGDIGVTSIQDEVLEMVDKFYKENVTVDDILDKMNESGKGIKVVSEFDKSILDKGF